MFEKIGNAVKSGVDAVKSADIGTLGKVVAGGVLLIASTALTIAGMGGTKREGEYSHIPYADQAYDTDETTQIEESVETEEKAED